MKTSLTVQKRTVCCEAAVLASVADRPNTRGAQMRFCRAASLELLLLVCCAPVASCRAVLSLGTEVIANWSSNTRQSEMVSMSLQLSALES